MQIPPFGFGPTEAIKQVSQWLGNPALNHAIKEAAQKLGIKEVPSAASVQEVLRQAGKWLERTAEPWMASGGDPSAPRSLEVGINATGEWFHPRWTAQPMSHNACRLAAHLHSGYSQDSGIAQDLQRLLISATGAADALVLRDIPTAVQLVVRAWVNDPSNRAEPHLAPHVLLPRIACLRIPISGTEAGVQLRPLIDATGAHVTEIGSNSDCLHDDYAKATAMHPHSLIFQATPIASQNDAYALSDHARSTGSLVCTLALDASLVDLDWTDCKTPALTRRWDSGPDLIIAPTQYLLGGPDAVVILGKKNAIDRIRPWADQLGAQADRVTQALLHCALSESLQPESWAKTYLGAMLNTPLANTENRAQRLAIQLQGLWPIQRTEVVTESTRIGNGTWQALRKPTAVLKIYPQSISAAKLNETLAQNQPAIWTQVYSDRIELVLRSVDPADDAQIVQAISKLQPVT